MKNGKAEDGAREMKLPERLADRVGREM